LCEPGRRRQGERQLASFDPPSPARSPQSTVTQLSVPSHIFRRKRSSLWACREIAAESVEAHNLETGSNFQAVLLSSISSKPFRRMTCQSRHFNNKDARVITRLGKLRPITELGGEATVL